MYFVVKEIREIDILFELRLATLAYIPGFPLAVQYLRVKLTGTCCENLH